MHVYTKINDKLAAFNVDTESPEEVIKVVRDEVGLRHRETILCLIRGGKIELADAA